MDRRGAARDATRVYSKLRKRVTKVIADYSSEQ